MINSFPLALSANVELVLDVSEATCISLFDATSSIKVRFNEASNWVPMRKGDDIGPHPVKFTKVTLLSTSSQNVTILVGDAEVRQSTNVNVNSSATVQSANTCKASTDVSVTATSKVLVIAANANRKAVLIKSLSTNTVGVRLGDNATVAANAGIQLDPGETATFDTEAAVYAFGGASAATLCITELERV